MNSSVKFFDPIVTVLLALAGFDWIVLPLGAPVVVDDVAAVLDDELLLELPHAARATLATSTAAATAALLTMSASSKPVGSRRVAGARSPSRRPRQAPRPRSTPRSCRRHRTPVR